MWVANSRIAVLLLDHEYSAVFQEYRIYQFSKSKCVFKEIYNCNCIKASVKRPTLNFFTEIMQFASPFVIGFLNTYKMLKSNDWK